jgi:hypothetical protein
MQAQEGDEEVFLTVGMQHCCLCGGVEVTLISRTATCGKGYPYVDCAGVNSLQDAAAIAIPCTH